MKLGEIFRFELAYQLRRVSTWLCFSVLVFFSFVWTTESYLGYALNGDYFFGAPFIVAEVTVVGCLFWTLLASHVAGNAAARDAETGMSPLVYTAPVGKAEYLGGRLLAAFVLHALILLAVPGGILLAVYSAEVGAEIRGPFRPAAYLTSFAFIALPAAFVASAIQFSLAALGRRATLSYLGGVILLVTAFALTLIVEPDVGRWLDPLGIVAIDDLRSGWTPIELNTRVVALEGWWLANRLLWLGIALGALGITYFRFHFGHHCATTWRRSSGPSRDAHSPQPAAPEIARSTPVFVPQARRRFGFATHARQTLALARDSFVSIAKSLGGLLLLSIVALLALLSLDPGHMGVPLLPRTDYVLHGLTFPGIPPAYLIIPLLIVYCSGELFWRERKAGLNEITDTAPVPEWVLFLGKFGGLGLVLALCMSLRMAAGMLAQASMGYYDFEIGLYLKILFGIQLADYLLLALLALVVHVVVNRKQIGHAVVLLTLVCLLAARGNEIGHGLLVYGFDPGWSYTDMRGFGGSLGPWLWFKLYWAAWALLLAVAARLLWVRNTEGGFRSRIQLARRRFTRPTAAAAAAATALIPALGGFIFYNTNVLNERLTPADGMQRRAQYERRYGQYRDIPQPRLSETILKVEIHPDQRKAEILGDYLLLNDSAAPIDSIHLDTQAGLQDVKLDRPAASVLADEKLGYRIYALDEPFQPGGSLRLSFALDIESRGFGNPGVDAPVAANGTYFTNQAWLPAIGYQPNRELASPGERRAHGLAPRAAIPSPYEVEANRRPIRARRIDFEAIVGTDGDQIALAPGRLRRTWTEDGRRYFHYSTDAPIGNEYALFSAEYAVHEAQWNDVAIRIFHHPGHDLNLGRMVRSIEASLDYYTEQFGAYPYRHIRLVEHPGHGIGMHSEATTIDYEEGFSLFNPKDGPQGLDLPFFVVSHEVAHQWWGAQLTLARTQGAGLLVESLASYSAYKVVEKSYGPQHLGRLLSSQRYSYQVPRSRAAVPLLRTTDAFLNYRKGPFAMHALSRYMGEERVNGALRRLLQEHLAGRPALLTSLDLYRELQAVTPDSLQSLLHDLFEANTFWELETERARASQTEAGLWQVSLDVRARKMAVDTAGVETPVPMDDWVEIGVFAPSEEGGELGEPIYLRKHRVRSGPQTITVIVAHEPVLAGIDPYHLLVDWETDDNTKEVESASANR